MTAAQAEARGAAISAAKTAAIAQLEQEAADAGKPLDQFVDDATLQEAIDYPGSDSVDRSIAQVIGNRAGAEAAAAFDKKGK